MTLSTDIIIRQPVNPADLFSDLMALLARFPGSPAEPEWDHEPERHQYVSRCGQGLPAWVFVHYAADGPLRVYDDERIGWEREDDPTWQVPDWNEHCIKVNLDTGYGYKGPGGAGCSDLHAFLIAAIYHWCAGRGVTDLRWENEFTGEWFESVLADPNAARCLPESA